MTTFRTNLGVGVTRGLAIGAFFAAGALVLRLVNGSRFLDDNYVSLLGLIAYDVLAGAATGAIVGSLLPLASRSSIGAALVGFVAMLPASFVGMLIVTPSDQWDRVIPIGSLVAAALLGGLIGPLLRSYYADEVTTNWRFVAIVVSTGTVVALIMYLAGWW